MLEIVMHMIENDMHLIS